MIKKFLKLGLIGTFLSAFFCGCNTDNESGLGGGLLTSSLDNSFRIDTFTVDSKIFLENENTISSNSAIMVTGKYSDDAFGDVTAQSFFQLEYANTDLSLENNPVCDSMKLFLEYSSFYSYGNIGTESNYELHPLTESFVNGKSYYTNNTLEFDTTNYVASQSFFLDPVDNTYLELDISNDVCNRILDIDPGKLENELAGFALTGSSNTSIQGFLINDGDSYFRLYYHNDVSDSLSTDLNFSENMFNHFEADRSGTDLSDLVTSGNSLTSDEVDNKVYIQSGVGIRTAVSFPYLDEFLNELDNAVITRAYVELHVDSTRNAAQRIKELDLYRTTDGIVADSIVDDIELTSFYANANDYRDFDSEGGVFRVPLTYHLQELVNSGRPSETYILKPLYEFARLNNLVGYDGSESNGDMKMKLVVYYTNSTLE